MSTLHVITGPTVEPITLAEAKLHLKVDHDADDQLITSLIKAARQQVELHTTRTLCTQTLRLTLDAFPAGCRPIELRSPPVQAVQSIEYRDASGTLVTLDAGTYELLPGEPGEIYFLAANRWPPTAYRPSAVRVTFTAGYGDASAVPEMAKAAIKLLIGGLYENREGTITGTIVAENPAVASLLSLLCWKAYR